MEDFAIELVFRAARGDFKLLPGGKSPALIAMFNAALACRDEEDLRNFAFILSAYDEPMAIRAIEIADALHRRKSHER